jgi:ribonuclease P protein component
MVTMTARPHFLRANAGKKSIAHTLILRQITSPEPSETLVRVGLTVSGKCGNAVVRNRIKRRLRAIIRKEFQLLMLAGHDYVFIARPNAAIADFATIARDVRYCLKKLA